RREFRRHGDHAAVGVDARYRPAVPDPGERGSPEHAGAASDVEHPVARLHANGVEHGCRPLAEQGRHVKRLVGSCGFDLVLQVRVRHGPLPTVPTGFALRLEAPRGPGTTHAGRSAPPRAPATDAPGHLLPARTESLTEMIGDFGTTVVMVRTARRKGAGRRSRAAKVDKWRSRANNSFTKSIRRETACLAHRRAPAEENGSGRTTKAPS